MKENGFTQKRQEVDVAPHKLLRTQTTQMTALLANTPTQAESLLHSLEEQAAGSIGLHVKADKPEYMCFNQKRDIFTLNGGSLNLEENFTYLRSIVRSTENDINMRLVKAWSAINRLSIISQTYPIK